MQLSHTPGSMSVSFDDENLVSAAGLVPAMSLARDAGLQKLADQWLTVPTDKGANAGLKVASLVAGMTAGADSIDDMGLLRHGGTGKLFKARYAPSTLGSFLRTFTFGHVRQLDAVASRFLGALASRTPLLPAPQQGYVFVDVDDTVIEVHGYAKQGSGYGYSGVRGLNALLATVTTGDAPPLVAAQRLRKGAAHSVRGAATLVTEALANVKKLNSRPPKMLLRADSAFYSQATVAAALKGGADVSVTMRMNPAVKRAIAAIADDAWTPIEYTDAIYDEETGTWISSAEVAEIPFTAFSTHRKVQRVPGRLVVRRIPELNHQAGQGQQSLFEIHRFHTFFTTASADTMDTVTADKTHRAHAVIEQVNADLKDSALAHLPSGLFTANAAWLVLATMAFNLTRAAAAVAGNQLAKARTGTIRRKLINIPARIASSARKLLLHLPKDWPWQTAFTDLFSTTLKPPNKAPA